MCTSKISCIGHGHAAEVCADAEHHEPLGLLDARRVRGGVAQFGHVDIVSRSNVLLLGEKKARKTDNKGNQQKKIIIKCVDVVTCKLKRDSGQNE